MNLSIVGLPQSGVTTVFNALTGRHEDAHAFAKPGQSHIAVVKVPDRRVDFLAGLYDPKKITHASVEYMEVPGLFAATAGGASSSAEAASTVRDSDACILVLRAFDAAAAPNPRGTNDPVRDLNDINDELLTLDLAQIEKRIERLRKDVQKPTPEQEQHKLELAALERCLAAIETGQHLDQVGLNANEEKLLRGFRFLTEKPRIHVVNVDESAVASAAVPEGLPPENSVAFCAEIEDEIGQLEEADRAEFLADLGIQELARDRLIETSYRMLGLISFLTIGKDEVRAWTLESGATAVEAAGTIHSDLERGFIRAEVFKYDDIERLGSEREVKAKGLARLEGRDYVVQDGDILNIRFGV
jgi:GTP-binding protein YchF